VGEKKDRERADRKGLEQGREGKGTGMSEVHKGRHSPGRAEGWEGGKTAGKCFCLFCS
jgi:hypothetical protein